VVGCAKGQVGALEAERDEVTVFDHTSSSRRMLLAKHSPVLGVVRSTSRLAQVLPL
jgi:hypothetical protein